MKDYSLTAAFLILPAVLIAAGTGRLQALTGNARSCLAEKRR